MKTKIQSLLFVGFVMLLAWLPASSFAATAAADAAFGRFMTNVVGAGQQTVSFGTGGQAVLSTASGNLAAEASGVTQIAGRAVPVVVRRSIAGAAAGALVGSAFPLFMTGVTGLAIYDLAIELGYTANPFGVVKRLDPTVCSVAPCYEYSGYTGWVKSLGAACNSYIGTRAFSDLVLSVVGSGAPPWNGNAGLASCVFVFAPNYTQPKPIGARAITPSSPVYVGSSVQELADAVASKSGWPTTSKLADTVADAVRAGLPLPAGVDTITGPASVAGTTTTKVNQDNSTTTKVEVHNVTYEGNKITVTTTTTSTTVMPDGSTKVESETKKNEPTPAEPPITCGLPNTPVCAVKVDETDTKKPVADTEFNPKADALKTPKDQALDRMKGTGDTAPLFSGWNMFFGAPAIVACEPFVLPSRNGVSMGSIDPCGVVDGMRSVMAYIWAAAGLFLCLGFVRQSVQGG